MKTYYTYSQGQKIVNYDFSVTIILSKNCIKIVNHDQKSCLFAFILVHKKVKKIMKFVFHILQIYQIAIIFNI